MRTAAGATCKNLPVPIHPVNSGADPRRGRACKNSVQLALRPEGESLTATNRTLTGCCLGPQIGSAPPLERGCWAVLGHAPLPRDPEPPGSLRGRPQTYAGAGGDGVYLVAERQRDRTGDQIGAIVAQLDVECPTQAGRSPSQVAVRSPGTAGASDVEGVLPPVVVDVG